MLRSFTREFREEANRLGFEIRYVGGLLKFYPLEAPTKVMLALDETDDPAWMAKLRIWQHRDDALTRDYKGRVVTWDWVLGFMKANSETAKECTSQAQEQARRLECEKRERRERLEADQRRIAAMPKERRVPGSSRACPSCLGYPSTSFRSQDEGPEIITCGQCEGGYIYEYRVMTDEEYYGLISQQLAQHQRSEKE